jgi:hypothetical protein
MGILLFPFRLFFTFEISEMFSGEQRASFDPVFAGLLPGAVNDSLEKIVISSDSGRVVGIESGKDGQKSNGAGLFHPLGDSALFGDGHQKKGTQHTIRLSVVCAVVGRIEAVEDFKSLVKIQVYQDNEFLYIGFEESEKCGIIRVVGKMAA